jgi:GalNAc-alpha-(1->4)-GalNAc-alpha-(1->3)-diNAcBac-PP-undecaprenol alpha-1,4-N-acetyl-D-galactosaminyltransferase
MENKKINICLLIHSLQAGGMERVMVELADYFASRSDTEVHLLLYGKNREIFYSVPAGVKVHTPSFFFNDSRRLWNTFKTMRFIRKKLILLQPNTVLSIGEYWNSLVLLAAWGLHIPIFVSDRNQPNKSLGKLHNALRRLLYPRAKGVIAQTAQAKKIYHSLYRHSNIDVIGNPIREIAGNVTVPKQKIVLTVGRLINSKHHDELISLFVRVHQPGWKLVIVGYDHLKQKNSERLQQLIDDKNANDKVVLVGKQIDVEQFYLQSRIFAFTSSSEGFPNVIGEAMSAGLPVVAFDCVAGPSDMIENGKNGFLVPLFDYDQFARKLLQLMQDDALVTRLGTQAKKDITRFSASAIGEAYFTFITKHFCSPNHT